MHWIRSYTRELTSAFMESSGLKPAQLVAWERPLSLFFKLNIDGSSKGNPGNLGAGGLIRDNSGNWVLGFTCFIGVCFSIQAKLWGLREGLKLALNMHIENPLVETDSQLSIHSIRNAHTSFHPRSPH
ncbi:RVT_3 domain-containing protein [Cephalotus follicularis]|uniref:RVT_3 domain-containing protein n=1 Tax=Cephalotus follicularis TaxID=3775 RepID=A0A1Q3CU13_CEPFO|nr:RVT_3 domain-containing protein [Cephalotus follicularis]